MSPFQTLPLLMSGLNLMCRARPWDGEKFLPKTLTK